MGSCVNVGSLEKKNKKIHFFRTMSMFRFQLLDDVGENVLLFVDGYFPILSFENWLRCSTKISKSKGPCFFYETL